MAGIHPDNTFPGAVDGFAGSLDPADLQARRRAEEACRCVPPAGPKSEIPRLEQRWINRGAINAGLAVFTYLNKFIKGTSRT